MCGCAWIADGVSSLFPGPGFPPGGCGRCEPRRQPALLGSSFSPARQLPSGAHKPAPRFHRLDYLNKASQRRIKGKELTEQEKAPSRSWEPLLIGLDGSGVESETRDQVSYRSLTPGPCLSTCRPCRRRGRRRPELSSAPESRQPGLRWSEAIRRSKPHFAVRCGSPWSGR